LELVFCGYDEKAILIASFTFFVNANRQIIFTEQETIMKYWRYALMLIALFGISRLIPVQIAAAAGSCTVTYASANDWGTGATINVTLTNTSTTALNGWTLAWTFSGTQVISNLWNGTFTQSGKAVTVTNASYNAAIGANGGTTTFGFNLNYTGTNQAPTSFTLNGTACGGSGSATNTPSSTATRIGSATNTATNTATRVSTATNTPTLTPTHVGSATNTPTNTATFVPPTVVTATSTSSSTPGITPTANTTGNLGNATWFSGLGSPYGGCGITQSALDSQYFVALNVQNTPGDYSTFFPRPITGANLAKIGYFNNGLNCGRWVKVTIDNYCTGVNSGAPNTPFCQNGSWVADAYNGATLDMIVADSCQDGNAWCRDDANHLDLAQGALNQFVKNGQPVGDMYPNHWNNRHIVWQFESAPNYTGDINIGFIMNAQAWWTPIAVTHLANGIHGIDYFQNGAWVKATTDSDMGQTYLIGALTAGGSTYQIRVYDVNDQLINNGRIYNFAFPASCGSNCSSAFTQVTYTTQ
jgi:hypothetical protein